MRKNYWILSPWLHAALLTACAVVLGLILVAAASADSGIGSRVGGLLKHDHSTDGKGGATLRTSGGATLGAAPSAATWKMSSGADNSPGLQITGFSTSQSASVFSLWKDSAQTTLLMYVDNDGSLVSQKSCAAGYTRATPNLCLIDVRGSNQILTSSVCTTVAAPAAGAKAVLVMASALARSANAIGARNALIYSYTTSGCTVVQRRLVESLAYEFSAVASQTLSVDSAEVLVPVVSGNIYLRSSVDAGGISTGFYVVHGYTD